MHGCYYINFFFSNLLCEISAKFLCTNLMEIGPQLIILEKLYYYKISTNFNSYDVSILSNSELIQFIHKVAEKI